MVPQGIVGRLSGAVCSLSGILVVALAAPILEKNFKQSPDDADDPRANEVPDDEKLLVAPVEPNDKEPQP